MIKIYIPGLPQKSYEYRRGDAQVIHDDKKNAIVIDGGEPELCNKIVAYCKNVGISHITYILTHWHEDHDAGMKQLLESSLVVDKIYCPPPSEVRTLTSDDGIAEYNRAMRRISLAKSLKKEIIYPAAGRTIAITVGKIKCNLWRRIASRADYDSYEVNNTSIQTYFPDLYYLTGGDIISAFSSYLKTKPGPIKVFKIPHHGNACTDEPCKLLKEAGAELCWYNDWEKKGSSVGSSNFSKWGAGYCRKYFTTLRTDNDIIMTAGAKSLVVQKGTQNWKFEIPFTDKLPENRWVKGSNGWWYEYSDGTYAVGWAKLKWSGGTDWFYFDKNGWMLTGWVYTGGYWYYLSSKTGVMLTGWLSYKGKKCYLEPKSGKNQGHAYRNETAVIGGKTYWFDNDCYATEIASKKVETPAASTKTRLNVIDIASYQASLDLTRMTGVGLDGVIIKATQGRSYINPYCNKHYAQAKQAGFVRGLYHYANGSGAKAEADFFVEQISGYIGDAILALDWEGNQNGAFGRNDVTYCKEFLDRVYERTGVRPLIYMSKSVCRKYNWASVAKDYGLWAAQYGSMNETGWKSLPWTDGASFGAWAYPVIYQYSSRGKLSGYSGNLDFDLAYLSPDQWAKFAKPSK